MNKNKKITTKTMAKARKEGKKRRNRSNWLKTLKMIEKNQELLKEFSKSI